MTDGRGVEYRSGTCKVKRPLSGRDGRRKGAKGKKGYTMMGREGRKGLKGK